MNESRREQTKHDNRRSSGSFPWFDYPREQWKVPCPYCDKQIHNHRDAFTAHWTSSSTCEGPQESRPPRLKHLSSSEWKSVYERLTDERDTEQRDEPRRTASGSEQKQTYRQQLVETLDSIRSGLDAADRHVSRGNSEIALEILSELEMHFNSAEQILHTHELDEFRERLTELERRHETRIESVTRSDRSESIPDEVGHAPDVSVDYDALTEEVPIGGGGNADVTRATFRAPNGDVTLAIKKPRMHGTLRRDEFDRMLAEARTWDKLDDHDHIVDVVDYGSEPIPWIAMEYMDGGHLGEQSDEMHTSRALWTALAITRAVYHAHRRGIAHLDLKPQNVLFRTMEDAWDVPKVADWGLSKHLLEQSKSVEGLSVEYAAPEQFDDDYGRTDYATDIYQLGAVFYELFTGRPPFEGQPFEIIDKIKARRPTPPSEIADVPDALDEVLLTALAKRKGDRYDDIVYFRDELEELLEK